MCLSCYIRSVNDFIFFRCVKNNLLFEIKINCLNMLKNSLPVLYCKLCYLCWSNSLSTAVNLFNGEIVPILPFVCFRLKMHVAFLSQNSAFFN